MIMHRVMHDVSVWLRDSTWDCGIVGSYFSRGSRRRLAAAKIKPQKHGILCVLLLCLLILDFRRVRSNVRRAGAAPFCFLLFAFCFLLLLFAICCKKQRGGCDGRLLAWHSMAAFHDTRNNSTREK